MRRDRIIEIPESLVKAAVNDVIVKDTRKLTSQKVGLIYLPDGDRQDFDKQFEIGEVVSKGCKVSDEINVGDIVIYRRLMAFWIPNGLDKPFLWKFEYPFAVLALVPASEAGEEPEPEPEFVPDLIYTQSREGNPIERGIRHYM